ncbi:LysR family transcriptional regulator [Levilactobacillus zymae]|uniref:LysR family transcriptional regulator YeiE n=1 Tax=Levilactobacillus zymae TaxID=267363 RepID=A0A1Y6JUB0_9LACO|nr:LysR family transcriptional regulator [Levilactobacillus zymae]SMS13435.1 LysR family transcriptional regulator YeiE [Levilactobacillus zymae]
MLDQRYQTFQVLVATKSYTRTAEELFITQPAVSQQIKSLETEVGVPLVHYQRPYLTITPAGQQLAAFIQRTQAQSTKLLNDLRQPGQQRQLTFSTTLSISEFLAPQLVRVLQREGHYRQINCQITNTQAALRALQTGTSDFALIEGNFEKHAFDYQVIRHEPFVGIVGAASPLAQSTRVTWADLTNYPLIIREGGSGSRDILLHLAQAANVSLADFPQVITVNHPAAICQLLLANVGVSFVYRSVVQAELAAGQLVELPLASGRLEHDLDLVYVKDNFFAADYAQLAAQLR